MLNLIELGIKNKSILKSDIFTFYIPALTDVTKKINLLDFKY